MPAQPVILANAEAGPKSTDIEELADLFGDIADVRPIGDDLTADVASAVDSGAPWVGVAGGDGSLRAAAPVLMAARRPLLAIPCGTKNHFALAVGTGTLEEALAAAEDGGSRLVDVGYVGDELFLNTASFGTYAAVVRERDRREHLPKRVADALGVVRQGFGGQRYRVEIDGVERRAWEVFAGNGRYGETLRTMNQRDGLDAGVLDVRLVLAEHKLARARLVVALVASTIGRTPVVERRVVEQVTIGLYGEDTALVALDGDALRFRSPMCWRVERAALPVRVPRDQVPVLRSPPSGD